MTVETAGARILVVDDEPNIAELLSAALTFEGYQVGVAGTGAEALEQVRAFRPHLVMLDVMLPDFDGNEVCRRLRSQGEQMPIVFLTARDTTQDKVEGLSMGDDYVTKPFSMPELLARLRVAVRHRREIGPFVDGLLEVGDVVVDMGGHRVTVAGRPVELTPKEFDFLALLARHQGKVLTHRKILQHVWGPEATGRTEYLRTYANQLRRKLQDDPMNPRLVTEPGVGYRLVARD